MSGQDLSRTPDVVDEGPLTVLFRCKHCGAVTATTDGPGVLEAVMLSFNGDHATCEVPLPV